MNNKQKEERRGYITFEEFKQKANKTHNNKYDYSIFVYDGWRVPGTIICPEPDHGTFKQEPHHHAYQGHQCPKCALISRSNKRRMSKEVFVEKANKVHNNKYNYDKVNYINNYTKIIIICSNPAHGEFLQQPTHHINRGDICPKCAGQHSYTTKEFIDKANKVHNNKYNYSKFEYINSKYVSTIICLEPEHGEFYQQPTNHLNQKQGCPKCCGNIVKTTDWFITEAKKIHGDKYDYSLVNYINIKTNIIILCPIHKEINILPSDHLRRCGCGKCGVIQGSQNRKYTIEEFIEKANKIHNYKYDYSKFIYTTGLAKSIIICSIHGDFLQTAHKHINSAHGCPKCSITISKPEISWLDLVGISEENRNKTVKYTIDNKNKSCRPDARILETKTVYNFEGDFWHGNPEIHKSEDINPMTKTAYGELYSKTIKRNDGLIKSGYKVISMWESDFDKIIAYIKNISEVDKSKIINDMKVMDGKDILIKYNIK